MMANFSFCLSLVFLLLGGGFPLGVDATTFRLTATSSLQNFTSTNYPFNYPHNTNDDWVIDSGLSHYRVRITVVDSSIESFNDCSNDYFSFTDGLQSGATSGRYCGSWSNCYFESSGRYATIYLKTDGRAAYKGFRMSYYRVLGTASTAVTSCTTGSTTTTTSSVLGSPLGVDATTYRLTATSSSQYFTSRNYPFNYLHNTNDDWVIDSGSSYYRIRITVVDSSLESSNDCSYDSFQFRDGLQSGATSGRYCGSWSNCYFESSGRYATISLKTDGSAAYRGFKISFYRVPGTALTAVTSCTTSSTTSGLVPGSHYRSGADSSAPVPVGWRVGCTLAVLVSFGRVGWEGFYV